MFFEKSWVPLVDVLSAVIVDARKDPPKPDMEDEDYSVEEWARRNPEGAQNWNRELEEWGLYTYTNAVAEAWDICDRVSCVAVMTLSGKHTLASKKLLDWDDPTSTAGRHVDLSYGTVGSAWNDDYNEPPSPEELTRTYGPFLGLPVVFRASEVSDARYAIKMQVQNRQTLIDVYEGHSPSDVAKRILATAELNGFITKETAMAMFGSAMTTGQFKLAWRKAAEVRPDLAKGGRRPGT